MWYLDCMTVQAYDRYAILYVFVNKLWKHWKSKIHAMQDAANISKPSHASLHTCNGETPRPVVLGDVLHGVTEPPSTWQRVVIMHIYGAKIVERVREKMSFA